MPAQIEARRLSGVDLGKTVEGTSKGVHGAIDMPIKGMLTSVEHIYAGYTTLGLRGHPGERTVKFTLDSESTVTVTGRAS